MSTQHRDKGKDSLLNKTQYEITPLVRYIDKTFED